jgi:hypothetical protein
VQYKDGHFEFSMQFLPQDAYGILAVVFRDDFIRPSGVLHRHIAAIATAHMQSAAHSTPQSTLLMPACLRSHAAPSMIAENTKNSQ